MNSCSFVLSFEGQTNLVQQRNIKSKTHIKINRAVLLVHTCLWPPDPGNIFFNHENAIVPVVTGSNPAADKSI